MRRFDIPAAPPLAGGRGDLLRLIDPRGRAVAWLDPQAGRCVGYAVRPAGVTVGGWRELLGGADRDVASDDEAPVGGAIAVGWPWPGEVSPEPPARWRLIERDPTAATCACRCVSVLARERVVALTLGAWLDEGVLRLRLVAQAADATSTLRPQFRLTVPGSGTTIERLAVTDTAQDARALRRAGVSLRLTVATQPQRHSTWWVETNAVGTICTASAAPFGALAGDEDVCVLAMTVGPLD